MPDHAGDRGAVLLILEPYDHLHIKQNRMNRIGVVAGARLAATHERWMPGTSVVYGRSIRVTGSVGRSLSSWLGR
jgi:hypothetical protein